ncbi:hypothetical protein ACVWZ3_010355 [Bradyrhizobium sp. i1.3.6]
MSAYPERQPACSLKQRACFRRKFRNVNRNTPIEQRISPWTQKLTSPPYEYTPFCNGADDVKPPE